MQWPYTELFILGLHLLRILLWCCPWESALQRQTVFSWVKSTPQRWYLPLTCRPVCNNITHSCTVIVQRLFCFYGISLTTFLLQTLDASGIASQLRLWLRHIPVHLFFLSNPFFASPLFKNLAGLSSGVLVTSVLPRSPLWLWKRASTGICPLDAT